MRRNRDGAPLATPVQVLTNPDGLNELTSRIIGCAMRVHREVGPGLLESVYGRCLLIELNAQGLHTLSGKAIHLTYGGVDLGPAFYLDLLVEDKVVVEVKSVATLAPVHQAQLITYLRLTGKAVGLLINFNVPVLKN